jgi:hypothetical protein
VKALIRRLRDECVRLAHADDVPLLVVPEGTCCRRCERLQGNEPHSRRDGPAKTHVSPATREGDRPLVNLGAFHRSDYGHGEACASWLPASASRSRRPHVTPMTGDKVLLRALQASLVGSTHE